ncbi:type VII secretion target [Mycolicibacterium sp.]|uniref:type VII secretion target n=1 Tax=Mycolicibacterium sp. TaxID=2320850 RepID=UPI0037C8F308
MGLLDVDPAGLQTLATQCQSWSVGVAASAPSASPAPSSQASAAAVDLVHSEAAMAGAALAGRIQSVATSLTTAAVQYTSTDDSSASELGALSRSL